jgi:transcriptional regulator with XRE-family HTH domain
MPRVRQKADAYAEADFWKSVEHCRVELGIQTYVELADRTGISRMTLSNYRNSVSDMSLSNLRKLVKTLSPDIPATLRLLGYTPREINNFKKGTEL